MNYNIEKYKELYNLAKEAFNEELSRAFRIDEKASKYLTVLTFLIGIYGFFIKQILQVILPPNDLIEWVLFLIFTVILLLLVVTWFQTFGVLKVHEYRKMPIDLDFFDKNELIDIYFTMAKGIKENMIQNRKTTDKKSKKLYKSYKLLQITIILFIVFIISFVIYAWQEERKVTSCHIYNAKGGIYMGKNKNSSQDQSATIQKPIQQFVHKPNPNIVPPNFDIVTEGYDPSKITKKDKKDK